MKLNLNLIKFLRRFTKRQTTITPIIDKRPLAIVNKTYYAALWVSDAPAFSDEEACYCYFGWGSAPTKYNGFEFYEGIGCAYISVDPSILAYTVKIATNETGFIIIPCDAIRDGTCTRAELESMKKYAVKYEEF